MVFSVFIPIVSIQLELSFTPVVYGCGSGVFHHVTEPPFTTGGPGAEGPLDQSSQPLQSPAAVLADAGAQAREAVKVQKQAWGGGVVSALDSPWGSEEDAALLSAGREPGPELW